ncbi:MAG: hypothetical protein HPPSJP_5330 [Candidatus Hepatoplasma scabrum]|nr:MAG: hypothetical protein HPPSJP_5330 [Candidatus Hepatoplasma sp.]
MKILIEKQINEKLDDFNKEELFIETEEKELLILNWKIIENIDKWNYRNLKKLVFLFLKLQKIDQEFKISYFRWNRNLEFILSYLKNRKFNFSNFKINDQFKSLFLSKDLIKIKNTFLQADEYTRQLINCFLLTKISLKEQKLINLAINTNIIENEIFFNFLINNYFNLEGQNEQ